MDDDQSTPNCVRIGGELPDRPTLIEGLPGHGLVASIAVDQITDQLGLDHHANIQSDDFPPVVTFDDGLVQNLVRVYAGENPPVMTLQSDLALPQSAYRPLSECVLSTMATEYRKAIFLVGAPAEHEEQLGNVTGVATTADIRSELEAAGIDIARERGVVGGVTGALVRECHRSEIPAALLIVRAHPRIPDPGAAKAVIETALEPLVDFDIDTSELEERADEIQQQLQQIARQYQEMSQERDEPSEPRTMGMYQ